MNTQVVVTHVYHILFFTVNALQWQSPWRCKSAHTHSHTTQRKETRANEQNDDAL